jgi:hypothetical protein
MAKRPLVEALGNLTTESTAVQNINENINKLADALQDALSTTEATENTMNVPLDMNGQRVINLPTPILPTDPIRLIDAPLFKGAKGDTGEKGDKGEKGSGVGVGNNLWFNPDASLGNGSEQVLPNHALNIYGPDRWTFQQTGLNPFETVSRVIMPEGDTAIFWMNGVFATGANTFATGTKTVTTNIPNLNFVAGLTVEMVDQFDITKKMFCTVSSYTGSTLVLNADSVSAGSTGSRTNWVIGRNGNTNKGKTTLVTTAPSAVGSDILTFADVSAFEEGATLEYPYDTNFQPIAGIQFGTYIVKKLSDKTIRISKPVVQRPGAAAGVGVLSGQSIPSYGNQGHYGYQDIAKDDIKSLRFGTPLARQTYFSFDVVSNVGGLKASVMLLGYKPTSPFIGRALTQSFPVETVRTRITVPIPGDTQHPDDTWIGAGLNGSWGTLGFAVDSKGTPTSLNIPDGVWTTAPGEGLGIGGSEKQTFQLGDMVGAWFKVTSVKWEVDNATPYESPTTLNNQYPTPISRIRDRKLPRIIYENQSNAAGLKKWHEYVKGDGTLGFGKLSDDEAVETATAIILNPDGSLNFPAYPDGDLEINGTKLGTVPYGFITYTPGVTASTPGATPPVFGPASGVYRKIGKTLFVQVSIPVTSIGTATGAVIVDLPIGATGREWFLVGSDSSAGTGGMIYGRIPAGQSVVQIRTTTGAFPAVNGSTLNLAGFFVTP